MTRTKAFINCQCSNKRNQRFPCFFRQRKAVAYPQIAETRGILIMTDSDGAGFVIRNFLKGSVDNSKIKNCYIPQIKGKEKRKAKGGKEGILGAESRYSDQVIINAIRKSGAEMISAKKIIFPKGKLLKPILSSDLRELKIQK